MVYMVTAGTFTKRVFQACRGDTIVVVGLKMRIGILVSGTVRSKNGRGGDAGANLTKH